MNISLLKKIVFVVLICFGYVIDTYANDSLLIDTYISKAKSFKYTNNDSSIYYFKETLLLSDDLKNEEKKVEILFSLITATIRAGDPVSAIRYCNEANKISQRMELRDAFVKSRIFTGNVYRNVGLTSEALEAFLEIEAEDKEDNKISIDNYIELKSYIAQSYYSINELDKCKSNLLEIISSIDDSDKNIKLPGTYILLSNISTHIDSMYFYLNKAEEILNYYPKATYEKVVILNNKALLNKALGKLSESKIQYIQAIHIAREQGYKSYLSNLYNNYAYQLIAENNMDSANLVLDEALLIAKEIDDLDLEASILDSYSDYFKEMGNFYKALEYKDESVDKRNKYKRKQQIQQSLFLSTVFETEQKEKEIIEQESEINRLWASVFGSIALIVLLITVVVYYRQKSAVRKAKLITVEREKSLEIADALIEGQDTERKRLAMDLHDGLGARLGTLRFKIDNLLSKDKYHKELSKDVDDIGNNIRELSHRMLPTQLDELGLIISLKNLLASINASGVFNMTLESNIDERLDPKIETHLYYLIYELVNNAMKHSGGNEIMIQIYDHDDSISISVEDNGKGLHPDKIKYGLGLKNINQRVAYLCGNIHIDSQVDEGSIFMIELPKKPHD
jgi:signal transduction histidine kinase